MPKKIVTATALAKIKAAAKAIRRNAKIPLSEALEEAARAAGFANYHQAVSGVDLDPVKQAIAAFQRCIRGDGTETLVQKCHNAWLDVVTANDPKLIGRLELQCATDIDLASTYYHTVSSYLMGAPSYEPDLGWIKVSGFVFEVPKAKQYSPLVELSDQQCEQLAADLVKVRTLPGGVFPGKIWVSRFGLAFSEHALDMMVDSHLLGMESSLGTTWRPKLARLPSVPSIGKVLVYVMVLMELPWRDDVSSWEDFDFHYAGEMERPDVRPPLEISVPSLSSEPARFYRAWDAMHGLGETIFGDGFEQLEDTVINELNSVPRTKPRIDFRVRPTMDMSGLQVYSITCQVSDDNILIKEMTLFDTISPGFAIGWMCHVLNVYVGHRAEIKTFASA